MKRLTHFILVSSFLQNKQHACKAPPGTATGDRVHTVECSAQPIANAVSRLQNSFKFTQQPKYVKIYRKNILQKVPKS